MCEWLAPFGDQMLNPPDRHSCR